jgi:hypothetical protein
MAIWDNVMRVRLLADVILLLSYSEPRDVGRWSLATCNMGIDDGVLAIGCLQLDGLLYISCFCIPELSKSELVQVKIRYRYDTSDVHRAGGDLPLSTSPLRIGIVQCIAANDSHRPRQDSVNQYSRRNPMFSDAGGDMIGCANMREVSDSTSADG